MSAVISYVAHHESYFRNWMENRLKLRSAEMLKLLKKQLSQAEKRITELDRLYIKIYEDNASGRLSDDRFSMMSKTYEDEQASLKAEAARLREEIEVQERQTENIEQFIQTAKKYAVLDGITPYALRELVSAIYVESPDKSSGHRVQRFHIRYALVSFIPLDELTKQETA